MGKYNIPHFKAGQIVMLEASPERRVYFLIVESNYLLLTLFGVRLEVPSLKQEWRAFASMNDVVVEHPIETSEYKKYAPLLKKNVYGKYEIK